jgi:hypothetical protein
MVRFIEQDMVTPKEMIQFYKRSLLDYSTDPSFENEGKMIIMEQGVKSLHRFLATQNLEQRLEMLVDQWHTVSKPEQKAKIEQWIEIVRNEFVQEFYAGLI